MRNGTRPSRQLPPTQLACSRKPSRSLRAVRLRPSSSLTIYERTRRGSLAPRCAPATSTRSPSFGHIPTISVTTPQRVRCRSFLCAKRLSAALFLESASPRLYTIDILQRYSNARIFSICMQAPRRRDRGRHRGAPGPTARRPAAHLPDDHP